MPCQEKCFWKEGAGGTPPVNPEARTGGLGDVNVTADPLQSRFREARLEGMTPGVEVERTLDRTWKEGDRER